MPAELQATMLPALSVQPLVENAIRHGVESGSGGGRIAIEVESDAAFLIVTVRNSVPDSGTVAVQGHGIGLMAVRTRLEAMADGAGSLETSSDSGEFVARLRIRTPPA